MPFSTWGANFVSFEPESGTLAAGESIDVVASYESVGLPKRRISGYFISSE